MANKQTTGATVSRLGVLMVLAHNAVPGNEVGPVDQARMLGEIESILNGGAGVPAKKIKERLKTRARRGGALITVGPIGIYGSN